MTRRCCFRRSRQAAALGKLGTLYGALLQAYAEGGTKCVVIRVHDVLEGPTVATNPAFVAGSLAQQMTQIIGDPVAKTGVYALLTAQALIGVKPKTLIAPGFTSQRPGGAANPVVGALIPVANSLRARIYMDAPSTSQADALAARTDWGSRRVCGPFYAPALIWDPTLSAYVARPQSASQAGLTMRVHQQLGAWYSSSNQLLQGVGGVAIPVFYASGDPNCDANLLNFQGINTIVQDGAGWKRWGNRTCSADPLWVFEAVGNCADMVYDAIEIAEKWMVDKPFSRQLLLDGAAGVNRFIRYLMKVGALVGGRCWLDPERNTAAMLQQGILSWSIDFEPPAPMEHIRIYAQRNGDYYNEVVREIASQIASQ